MLLQIDNWEYLFFRKYKISRKIRFAREVNSIFAQILTKIMTTTDQIKDLKSRLVALRRYL